MYLFPVPKEGQLVAGEAGAFHARASAESTGIVCFKLTGLVPGGRLSARDSSAIHHGGSGLQGTGPQGGARGLLPQAQPREDVRKANEQPDSCSLLKSAPGPL